jgi:hypothetical protein
MFEAPDLLRRFRSGACASATVLLAASGLLSGCSDVTQALSLDPGGVSPSSPVARQTVAASRANLRAPRLADIPPVPKGLTPASEIKGSVIRLVSDRRNLNDLIFALPPAPADTDHFLARSRDVLIARGLTPPPEDQSAQTEAFASDIRSSVQPPPTPKETAPRR